MNGSCYPIGPDAACSTVNPNGLCSGLSACIGGYCQALNQNNQCSTKYPNGYCSGGATCNRGTCVQLPCGNGGYDCSASAIPGALCVDGNCVGQTATCDAAHPNGACVSATDACVDGICGQPTCSYANPSGACAAGLVCYAAGDPNHCKASDSSGCCNAGPCAPGSTSAGACPDPANQTCTDGQCVLNACSAQSTEGYCTDSLTTYDPNGKSYTVNAQCCDAALKANFNCVLGACTYPTCSVANPHGICPQVASGIEQVCDPAGSGTCVNALCTPYFQSGYCTDASLTCVAGSCNKVNCAGQSDPNAYCAPYVCDNDQCKQPSCSPAYTNGTCTGGQTCCNSNQIAAGQTACTNAKIGTCFAPNCSAQFPGGACASGYVCASGTCTQLPCGASYTDPSSGATVVSTTGTCGKNYACTVDNAHNPNIYCKLQPCSSSAPGGNCNDVDTFGDRCVSGSCVAYKCSDTFPSGPCATAGQICGGGVVGNPNVCATPACSSTYPGGSCSSGYACSNGTCVQLPCSGSNPTGACPANETCCNAGNQNSSLVACLASNHNQCVHNNCSSGNPNGACSNGNVCVSGTCKSSNCSAAFPNGPCSGGNICVSGTCKQPNCSTTYPGGACSNGNVCANGVCVQPGCSSTNQSGYCPAGQQCCASGAACDTQNHNNVGHCVQLPCSTSAPEGYCATGGQVCCDSNYVNNPGLSGCTSSTKGQCFAATCSATFPAGKCANSNQVCINASCVFPCSGSNPTGFCPSGFACVGAVHGQGGCATTCDSGNDSDCDYILNTDEGASALTDTDGDGIPDAWDTDSDNDSIPDAVEAGDHVYTTAPVSSNPAGVPNFRSIDSDGDHLLDSFEAGPAPAVPRDTDGDGFADYVDPDSDNDGIYDICEARDPSGASGLCKNTNNLSTVCTTPGCLGAIDTDGDGTPDFRQKDSDGDGVIDAIEARTNPWDGSTLNPNGVDHDSDGAPDYRDPDSDNDSVLDADEDANGNGIVDCQLDGNGNDVVDSRPMPVCGSTSTPFSSATPYNYNPLCQSSGNASKCVLSETNRVFADTDGNGIGDGSDGIFEVCSTANLKPVNIFFSQVADYAFALEQQYTNIRQLTLNSNQAGLSFDDPVSSHGSGAVSGFILARTPDHNAIIASPNTLVQKALAQSNVDAAKMAAASAVQTTSFGLTINRNFTTFDGYGAVVDQYAFNSNSVTSAQMRDNILQALTSSGLTLSPTASSINPSSPTAVSWVLQMETLYRYDGRVIVVGAVTPAGSNPNSTASYSYRTLCSVQTTQSGCQARPGCSWSGSACSESSNYQIPLFYSDNIANGSAVTQWGDSTGKLCESLVQNNSIVDFLWTVDSSGSMAPKIGQVSNASALFFPILENSEADYRVSYTTTSQNSPYWPPAFPGCNGITAQAPCEAWSTQGGCSWTGSACVPMCTAWNGAGNSATCASHGCVFNSSTNLCTWGGCSALNANTNAAWVKSMCTYYDCTWNASTSQCQFSGLADRTGGALAMDFTGAIGGITNLSSSDRSVSYACSEGCASPTNVCANLTTATACGYNSACSWSSKTSTCTNTAGDYCGLYTSATSCATNAYLGCAWNGSACVSNCCPACLTNSGATPNDPACYFAARLPNDEGSGYEFGLLTTEWALYRAGAQSGCGANGSNSIACNATPGCIYTSGQCIQAYCYDGIQNPNSVYPNNNQSQCNSDPNKFYTSLQGANGTPTTFTSATIATHNYGGLNTSPTNCEWDPNINFCVPSTGLRCNVNSTQATCVAAANGRCAWNSSLSVCAPNPQLSGTMCSATTQAACVQQGFGTCQWDTCNYATAATCNAVYGCGWSNGTCSPLTNSGTCRPPLKRMLRNNATKVAVLVSDEEECYEKDGPSSYYTSAYDGDCTGGQFTGGLMSYTDPTRVARVNAFSAYMQSLGVLTFALTGDQANKALAPETTSRTNGGCTGTYYNAESGQAYIDVAQSTGGGWGSLCAANLFPSTEAVVINALAKASPYKLLGFVTLNGVNETVQPISSTIEVATQSCVNPAEYPNCGSGTHVTVVPRSRDNGYDYDAVNNTLILYGAARPVSLGSITVSYKYWQNQNEPNSGSTACPCPSTVSPGCACPTGEVCGIKGSGTGTTNTCSGVTTALQCAQTPGCLWNSAENPQNTNQVGFCEADGLCAPDPTCGGTCATGESCNPSLGLCVCDPSCGSVGGCNAGSKCDNNSACSGLTQGSCSGSCQWDSNLQACYSKTCGECLCDTTCGGGCAAGQTCNTNTSSNTCGQCTCDTTCGGGCPSGETCNSNVNSATCGFCEPAGCTSQSDCKTAGQVCVSGYCVCDTTCGGNACGTGQQCNGDTSTPTCGTCGCDPTCGGSCPAGQTCDSNSTSSTCGLCLVDTTCGGGCNQGVCRASTQSACNALGSSCRWSVKNSACEPAACKACNSSNGLCGPDSTCCGGCDQGYTCNSATGQCVCDTTCGGSCPLGQMCDQNAADASCGQCVCDPTCNGGCLSGQICNSNLASANCGLCSPDPLCGEPNGNCNPNCTANANATACAKNSSCRWEAWANNGQGLCEPIQCKTCVSSQGFCEADPTCCGGCGPTELCNTALGKCQCDTSCGGGCAQAGYLCDSNTTSPTCGSCVCDTTCGGASCPAGEVCDTGLSSATCGQCVISANCGGQCAAPLVCNPTTGLCGTNPACGGCPTGYSCNYTTGECVLSGGG